MSLILAKPTAGKLVCAKGQPVSVDPYRSQVSLLLHGDGTNGSTTITDSSPTPKTVTAVGNAQISTAVADPFANSTRGVLAFDGNGDYLTLNTNANDIAFGVADFTFEFWLYMQVVPSAGTYKSLVDWRPQSQTPQVAPTLYIDGSTLHYFANGANRISQSSAISLQTWQHISVARSAGVTKMFVNGSQAGSNYIDANNYIASAGRPYVGLFSDLNNSPFPTADLTSSPNGYIDELRITKGVARYTSNFTPPTAPFPDF